MRSIIVLTLMVTFGNAGIVINLEAYNETDFNINYSGNAEDIISDKDVSMFNIETQNLKSAVQSFYGTYPTDVFLKSPTPWGDLYKTNVCMKEVKRILRVQNVTIKRNSLKKTIILSHDFQNPSHFTVKVNAGLSQSVTNTITTTWSLTKDRSKSEETVYDVSVSFLHFADATSISFTSTWGKSEERSKSVTIGSTSAVEIELKPGQSATALWTAKRSELEIEVAYVATLRGTVAVNFRRSYKGHHFHGPSINDILKKAGMETEIVIYETIKLGTFLEASLKVFDKETGLPL